MRVLVFSMFGGPGQKGTVIVKMHEGIPSVPAFVMRHQSYSDVVEEIKAFFREVGESMKADGKDLGINPESIKIQLPTHEDERTFVIADGSAIGFIVGVRFRGVESFNMN